MKTLRQLTLFALSFVLFSGLPAAGQELGEELEVFGPLVGQTWVGHYSNPEDSHYVHVLRFETILDGRAVRMSKNVDELFFELETLYYWDEEKQQIAYVSTTNKGQVSRGVIILDSGEVVLNGESVRQGGNQEYKQSFRVTDEGILEDRSFLKSGDQWQQRHLIVMKGSGNQGEK